VTRAQARDQLERIANALARLRGRLGGDPVHLGVIESSERHPTARAEDEERPVRAGRERGTTLGKSLPRDDARDGLVVGRAHPVVVARGGVALRVVIPFQERAQTAVAAPARRLDVARTGRDGPIGRGGDDALEVREIGGNKVELLVEMAEPRRDLFKLVDRVPRLTHGNRPGPHIRERRAGFERLHTVHLHPGALRFATPVSRRLRQNRRRDTGRRPARAFTFRPANSHRLSRIFGVSHLRVRS